MIEGTVNAAYEAVILLTVQGPAGRSREIEAVVDTGYDGRLTLPSALALALELPFVTINPVILADGSEVTLDVRSASVLWDGLPLSVDVHISDAFPLVGMRLLSGHNLNIDVEDGGQVLITAKA